MRLYVSLFPESKITKLEHWPGKEGGPGDTVWHGEIRIGGLTIRMFDSPSPHEFTFTPATSLFVDFDNEEELDAVFHELEKDGSVMMPLGSYDFSRRFAWVSDRFGVSWQLNLPHESA